MPHRSPPARIALTPATDTLTAGDYVELELTLGWDPPKLSEDELAVADAQAGAMLRRALGERTTLDDYDNRPDVTPDTSPRLTGRLLSETPNGASLVVLGTFDSAWKFERKLRFRAPEGPFRFAIYGTVNTPAGKSDFVVRGPLVVGVKEGL